MNNEKVKYNPFNRGPFPVGVLTQDLYELLGKQRRKIQAQFSTEIWYPATDEHHGQDLSEETRDKYYFMDILLNQEAVRDANLRDGTFPLIIFSHGFGGDRRQSSHLCCHLASHGYVVVSADHIDNIIIDLMSSETKNMQEIGKIQGQAIVNRPRDIRFLINCVLENKTSIPSDAIEEESIGVAGYSAGGGTILTAASKDDRISAALPIASMGIPPKSMNWNHEVSMLYIAAEKDILVRKSSLHNLFNQTPEPKSMVILNNANHFHFMTFMELAHEMMRTQPELVYGNTSFAKILKRKLLPFSELCPEKQAKDFSRGLGLAHMDACLKKKSDAMEWLKGDIKALMADQGVSVSLP